MKRKNILLVATLTLALTITGLGIGSASTTVNAATDTEDLFNIRYMFRLYNPNNGEHFYTSDVGEQSHLIEIGWNDEGLGWTSPASGIPIYRLYNPYSGEHHYTKDENERDYLKSHGWNYEGIGWYTDDDEDACITAVYRLYNPNVGGTQYEAGSHHYTMDENERDTLKANGWNYEGISWYSSHMMEYGAGWKATCMGEGFTGDITCTKCHKTIPGKVIPQLQNHDNAVYFEETRDIAGPDWESIFYCTICNQELDAGYSVEGSQKVIDHFRNVHGLTQVYSNDELRKIQDEWIAENYPDNYLDGVLAWEVEGRSQYVNTDDHEFLYDNIDYGRRDKDFSNAQLLEYAHYECPDCGRVSLDGKNWTYDESILYPTDSPWHPDYWKIEAREDGWSEEFE